MTHDPKAYWRDVPADAKHGFLAYSNYDRAKADEMFLDTLRICTPADHVLEIGCNAGTNLEHLRREGLSHFTAIEINPRAVEHFSKIYPETFAMTAVHVGDALPLMRALPDRAFDLVFTKGCLTNIPPSDDEILSHMARVVRRAILIREADPVGGRQVGYARDYEKIFADLGFELILKKLHYGGGWGNIDPKRTNNTWLRLFVRETVKPKPYRD